MGAPFWIEHAEYAGEYRDRDEWLELRRGGIGSSDCSAVLGMSKYESPFSVWVDKTGRGRPDDETEAMMWGTLLEPVIRAQLSIRLGLDIEECATLRSRERPWQLYNPDGLIPETGELVEIKNASGWLAQEWADDGVPDHAELQVQHGMAVTGAVGAYVAGLIGGNRMKYEYIPRDDHLINNVIIPAEQHFWDTYVLGDEQPPIDGTDATTDAIAHLWPRRFDQTEVAEDVSEVVAAVADYEAALAAEKAGKKAKDQATNVLAALMRGADVLTDAAGNKLVARKRGQFREKAFLEEFDGAPEWMHKVEVVDRDRMKVEDPVLFRRFQSASIYVPKGK